MPAWSVRSFLTIFFVRGLDSAVLAGGRVAPTLLGVAQRRLVLRFAVVRAQAPAYDPTRMMRYGL